MLLFLSLENSDEAVRRVSERVKQGGHPVPDEVVRRRFEAGLRNLREHYAGRVDEWKLYDNSGLVPVLMEQGGNRD